MTSITEISSVQITFSHFVVSFTISVFYPMSNHSILFFWFFAVPTFTVDLTVMHLGSYLVPNRHTHSKCLNDDK